MPQKKASIKDLRQSQKRYEYHRRLKKSIKDLKKQTLKEIAAKHPDKASEHYRQLQKMLDKATKRGFIKANTGARHKSRLGLKISSAQKTAR